MKKKTGIIITIIIISMILIVAGIFAFLYFATDIFKSNEQLFWKYASNSSQLAKMITNENKTEQKNWKATHSYTAKGDLSIAVTKETGTQTIKLGTTEKYNQNTRRNYADITLYNGEAEHLKASYINSEDIYAIYCKDIYEPYYIGFRNSDLKQFIEKLGIPNTENIGIPDAISFGRSKNVPKLPPSISEEEKYLSDTYFNMLLNSIPEERYTKTEKESITINNQSYETVGYQLDLSGEEIKQIIVNLLSKAKDDEQLINYLSLKVFSDFDKESIQKIIDGMITGVQQIQNPVDKISFVAYQPKKGITKIRIKDNRIAEIVIDIDDSKENKKNVDISFNSSESENAQMQTVMQVEMEKQILDSMIIYTTNIVDNKSGYQLVMNTSLGNVMEDKIENNSKITIFDNDTTIETSYYKTIQVANEEVDIQELTNTSAVVVNNYPREQLENFFEGLGRRIEQIIPEKVEQLNIQVTNEQDGLYYLQGIISSIFTIMNVNGIPQPISTTGMFIMANLNQSMLTTNNTIQNGQQTPNQIMQQEIELFNQRFEIYKGEDVNGTIVKTLITNVVTNNTSSEENDKIVKVRLDGNRTKKPNNWNEQGEDDTTKLTQLKDNIDAGMKYSVTIEYNTKGFVEIITITEI